MITSKMSLLYTYTFFLIGKRDYDIDHSSLRAAIARWFFMVTLTGRYTGSPETVMEQDLARLRSIGDAEGFIALLGRIVHDTLTDDFWDITLPNSLDVSAAQSPALFAYYAALNLLDARAHGMRNEPSLIRAWAWEDRSWFSVFRNAAVFPHAF